MESGSSTLYGDLIAEQPNDHWNNGDYSSSAASLSELYHLRHIMQQHQDMINHYNLCLTRLHEAAEVTEALRQENNALRSTNRDLNKQLSALIQDSKGNHFASSDHHNATPLDLVNELQGLCLGGDSGSGVSHRGKTRDPTLLGNASQLNGAVYVQGGKRQDQTLELEVYNQGMLKTDLCNKWQETGACLYGDHCQFAHGIEQLHPIICHPRYKSEICRDTCW